MTLRIGHWVFPNSEWPVGTSPNIPTPQIGFDPAKLNDSLSLFFCLTISAVQVSCCCYIGDEDVTLLVVLLKEYREDGVDTITNLSSQWTSFSVEVRRPGSTSQEPSNGNSSSDRDKSWISKNLQSVMTNCGPALSRENRSPRASPYIRTQCHDRTFASGCGVRSRPICVQAAVERLFS
jgi:hypothetical protein